MQRQRPTAGKGFSISESPAELNYLPLGVTLRETSTLDMTWEFLLAHNNTNAIMRPSSTSTCFLLLLQS